MTIERCIGFAEQLQQMSDLIWKKYGNPKHFGKTIRLLAKAGMLKEENLVDYFRYLNIKGQLNRCLYRWYYGYEE